jgi:hypothetical protein
MIELSTKIIFFPSVLGGLGLDKTVNDRVKEDTSNTDTAAE